MPKINKPKKKNLPVAIKTTKKRNKNSPVDYYNCLLTQAQQDWSDPATGKKKPVTACCKECKLNAPKLNEQRKQEVKKLVVAYHQVGASLKKLLQPLK